MLFVYPYIKPEGFDGLKYSFRSLSCYDVEILVLGDSPPWAKNITHVNITRSENTEQSLGNCYKWLITNLPNTNFVWMNDDIYALKKDEDIMTPKIVEDLNLIKYRGKRRWNRLLWDTFDQCKTLGLHGFNYETHLPYFMNTDALKYVSQMFNILSGEALLATSYFNVMSSEYGVCDNKLGVYKPHDPIVELLKHKWFNHGDYGFCDGIIKFLEKKFPEKSRFESC